MKLDPKEKREKIFDALRDLFIKQSQMRTLILAIEDLHWIDKTTEEFLDYLIGWLTSTADPPHSSLPARVHAPLGPQILSHASGWTQLPLPTSAELVRSILA